MFYSVKYYSRFLFCTEKNAQKDALALPARVEVTHKVSHC